MPAVLLVWAVFVGLYVMGFHSQLVVRKACISLAQDAKISQTSH